MTDQPSPITPATKRRVRQLSFGLFFFIVIATGFFGTAGAVVAAVVAVIVVVAYVVWLRRIVVEAKATGQWNADG